MTEENRSHYHPANGRLPLPRSTWFNLQLHRFPSRLLLRIKNNTATAEKIVHTATYSNSVAAASPQLHIPAQTVQLSRSNSRYVAHIPSYHPLTCLYCKQLICSYFLSLC